MKKKKEISEYTWMEMMTVGLAVFSIGMAIAVVGYLLVSHSH
ncbi:MAG: hypothetical protein ACREGI_04845 [Candidatus Levyibacteriota bacterium]